MSLATVVMTLAVPDLSGAPRVALEYARGLTAHGHRVVLAYGPLHVGAGGARRGDIVESFQALGAVTAEVSSLRSPLGPAAPRAVAALAQRHGADVIVGVQQRDRVVALLAAGRCGVPGVVTLQNRHVFWGRWPISALKERYYRWHLRRTAALAVCVSETVAEEAVQRLGVAPARIVTIPNAVAPARPVQAADVAMRRDEFLAGDAPLLVSVGRIDPQKGFDILLDALAELVVEFPGLRAVIVGGTTRGARAAHAEQHHRDLLAQVRRLGLDATVVFTGFRSDVAEILHAADIYVQPSRWEGFPLTLLEAMQAERPVVATEGAGRPTGFVEGTHGSIVPTGHPHALAAATAVMLRATPEQRQMMGRASGDLVSSTYRIENVRDGFATAIDQLLSRHPTAR